VRSCYAVRLGGMLKSVRGLRVNIIKWQVKFNPVA